MDLFDIIILVSYFSHFISSFFIPSKFVTFNTYSPSFSLKYITQWLTELYIHSRCKKRSSLDPILGNIKPRSHHEHLPPEDPF